MSSPPSSGGPPGPPGGPPGPSTPAGETHSSLGVIDIIGLVLMVVLCCTAFSFTVFVGVMTYKSQQSGEEPPSWVPPGFGMVRDGAGFVFAKARRQQYDSV